MVIYTCIYREREYPIHDPSPNDKNNALYLQLSDIYHKLAIAPLYWKAQLRLPGEFPKWCYTVTLYYSTKSYLVRAKDKNISMSGHFSGWDHSYMSTPDSKQEAYTVTTLVNVIEEENINSAFLTISEIW